MKLVDRLPELPIHVARRRGDELIEDRLQGGDPAIEIVLGKSFCPTPDGSPVVGRAEECDGWDTAQRNQVVFEVRLHGAHEHDLRYASLDGGRRRKIRDDEVGYVAEVTLELLREFLEHTGPVVVRRAHHELVSSDLDREFASMRDEAIAERLRVQIDVKTKGLGDAQPE